MTREEAQRILATWLVSSKGADGQCGYIEGWFDEDDAEAFRMAIEALKAPTKNTNTPTDTPIDLISRQDAIDALGEEPDIWNDTEEEWAYRNAWVEHISAIKALPSAGQNCVLCEYYTEIETYDGIKGKCTRRTGSEPKTGKWIRDKKTEKEEQLMFHKVWTCSECGERQCRPKPSNYCPNCGAKMRGDSE